MIKLERIKQISQQVAEAIAAALGVEVEIIDSELIRIAGTGKVRTDVGTRLRRGFVNKHVITTGEYVFIDAAGYHPICLSCPLTGQCYYLASIVYPIKYNASVIGSISLTAFDAGQKEKLLGNSETLLAFIARMADLITGKLAEEEMMAEKILMANRIEAVVNSIYEGILAVDENGIITHCNNSAERMFAIRKDAITGKVIKDALPIEPIIEALQNQKGFNARVVSLHVEGHKKKFLCTAKTIRDQEERPAGIVASFRDYDETQRLAYQIIASQEMITFNDIIGASPALQKVKNRAQKIANSDSTVLILGESGTGKEVFARAIHAASPHKNKPFIAINCGAIPETLLESELFGYEEGAFTGARRGGKIGKLELANGGTIFLDEIGNMSFYLQAKLLRVLQERSIERVGGTRLIPISARIIAATNSDLEAMVKKGQFRSDLYYRLSVIPLVIPPLRERPEDIPLLLEHFLHRFNTLLNKNIAGFSTEALALCQQYPWPGNVRELINSVEYAVNLEEGPLITPKSLPERLRDYGREEVSGVPAEDEIEPLEEIEKRAIIHALDKYGWTEEGKYQAAKKLGISRATIYRKIKKYRLQG